MVSFGLANTSFANLSEMGVGKTLGTIELISRIIRQKKSAEISVLVIAPKTIIESGWCSDIKEFHPELSAVAVVGTKAQKIKILQKEATFYITNYETLNQGFDFSSSGFDFLVCDEAVKLKNHRAKWTKAITDLGRYVPHRVILSGLISPNDLMEVYAPFNFLESGIFGKSFYSFRSRYFTPDPWSYQNRKWIPKKGAEQKIADKISHLIIRYTKDECLDLPDKIHTVRRTEMTPKQKSHYSVMKRDAILQLKDETVSALNKASLISKLAQISSGFIYDANKKIHEFSDSSKLKELKQIMEGELSGRQILIFTNFKAETRLFKEKFPGQSYIYGGQNDVEQKSMIAAFKAGMTQYMFASMAAAKYGLTFVNCSNVIYYSLNYSLDDFAQSQDRIHRIGQNRICQYIYLLNKGTVDNQIYRALMTKKKLNELIIELIEEFTR